MLPDVDSWPLCAAGDNHPSQVVDAPKVPTTMIFRRLPRDQCTPFQTALSSLLYWRSIACVSGSGVNKSTRCWEPNVTGNDDPLFHWWWLPEYIVHVYCFHLENTQQHMEQLTIKYVWTVYPIQTHWKKAVNEKTVNAIVVGWDQMETIVLNVSLESTNQKV